MPKLPLEYTLNDFSGGLNDNTKTSTISDNQASVLKNFIVRDGYLSKRFGYRKYADSFSLKGMYRYYKSNNTSEFLAVGSTHLFKETSTGVFDEIPKDAALPTSIGSDKMRFVAKKDRNGNDACLLYNGGKLMVYNGTNLAYVTAYTPTSDELTQVGANDFNNLTAIHTMATKDGRIIVQGNPNKKNLLNMSAISLKTGGEQYDYFPANLTIILDTNSNDEVVDIKTFRDQLIVFCKRSIHSIQGTLDTQLTADDRIIKLNATAGVVSKNSILEVEDSIFYLTDTGVYQLYNTDQNFVSSRCISLAVNSLLKKLVGRIDAKATYWNRRYILAFNDGTVLIYDVDSGSWSVWEKIYVGGFLTYGTDLYFTDSRDGNVYVFDETLYTDDGATYKAEYNSKTFDFGFPISQKKLKELWIVGQQYLEKSSTYQVQIVADYVTVTPQEQDFDDSGVWGEGKWGNCFWGWREVVEDKLKPRSKGLTYKLKITSQDDGPLDIFTIIFKGSIKKK